MQTQKNKEFMGNMIDVAEVCGEDIALKLLKNFPSTHFYIPHEPNKDLECFTPEEAQTLIRYYAGDTIYITSSNNHNRSRGAEVMALVDQGKPTREIALQLGMSQSRVCQLKRKYAHLSKKEPLETRIS